MRPAAAVAALLLTVSVEAGPTAETLLQAAASAYRQGDLLAALDRSSEALAAEPQNAVAKNYVWTITQDLRKNRPHLRPGEKEKAGALARRHLDEQRRRTESALEKLREASRKSGDLRSPTGLLTALGELSPESAAAGGAEGQVYMDTILENISLALQRQVFATRKDHLRAEGYLAYHQKDWPRAVALWEKALREDPDDAQVKNDLESLKTVMAREERRGRLKEVLAQAETFQETGLYAQAVTAWREVLAIDPRRPGAVESLAASRVALEKTQQLKKLDAMNEEAAALYQQGKHLAAAEIWLEALQLDPTYKKARVWLKLVGKRLERPEAAAAAPAPAPTASAPAPAPNGSKAELLYKRGLVAYAEGHLEEANTLWRDALTSNPSLKKAQEALKQGESELALIRR